MRRQNLWIAMLAATATLGTSAVQADFIDDSNVQLKFKNFYLDRQFNQDTNTADASHGNWTQAVTLDAKSGYHDIGGIQVGADLLAQYAVSLNGGNGNDIHMPYDAAKGEPERDNAKLGVTLKAKVGQTELKIGDLAPMSPVLFFDPSRQLITTYNGAWLESKDIKDTKLTLAYIDGINARNDNQYADLGLLLKPANTTDDGMYIAGVDHQITPAIGASYWYANLTDIYQQHYIGANYKTTLADESKLDLHARYYDTSGTGDQLAGDLDHNALSLGAKLNRGMHTVQFGYQQMFGEFTDYGMFPTLAGYAPQPFFDNWSVASFILKDERSWSLGYTYNFKDVGVPGLTTTLRHFRGDNIDLGGGVEGKENETNVIVNYVVPEGKLKGLGFNYMFIDTNYDWKNDLEEHRIATTYTYKF